MFDRSQEFKDSLAIQSYRVCQEGLPRLLPYITRQRLYLPLAILKQLLKVRMAALPRQVQYFHPDERDAMKMLTTAEGENPAVWVLANFLEDSMLF